MRRKFASRCCKGTPSLAVFFIDCLKVCTIRSANLFDVGWYGDTRMCLSPLALQKLANSDELNWGPLSLTNCSGMP